MEKPLEEIFDKLRGLLGHSSPEYGLLTALEDEVEMLAEKADEAEELEKEVSSLEIQLSESPSEEDAFEEGFYYIKYPDWQLGANPFLHDQLEEYINQHGVEETLEVLTQDHSREVEEYCWVIEDLKDQLSEARVGEWAANQGY